MQNENNDQPVEDKFPDEYLFAVSTKSPWYADIANYLAIGKMPFHLSPREKRRIVHNSTSYSWINEELYKEGPDIIIRRYVREDEIPEILKAFHDEPRGGHFSDRRIVYKIFLLGYY